MLIVFTSAHITSLIHSMTSSHMSSFTLTSPFYIERSPRKTLQIVERFGVRFGYRLLLLGQSVVLFVYHFDLVLVVGNLRRWTPLTFSIDTSLPSSKDALNVIATLSKSALIKPFSLRKVFPLVVVIESIILNVCWWFLP